MSINISNFTSKNNPPWLLAEPTGARLAAGTERTGPGDRHRQPGRLRLPPRPL